MDKCADVLKGVTVQLIDCTKSVSHNVMNEGCKLIGK